MSPEAVSSFAPQTLGKEPKFSRPRVLIADDHDMVLEHVLSLLQQYEVVGTAHNGVELVTEALRLQPDLIVSDITMPLLNGIDALQELREAGSTARFVFLTVHEQRAFLDACFAEGASAYITKSHLGTDLLPALNDALCGRHFISPSLRH
jgi:DNA-binding NarL/FixJ family response regulator